jgi:hypothetical protein
VNSAYYSEMQCDEIKPVIWSEWRGLLCKGLCCCTTMPVFTLLPTLLKPLRN